MTFFGAVWLRRDAAKRLNVFLLPGGNVAVKCARSPYGGDTMRFRWLWFLCMLPLLSLSVLTPAALAAEGSRPNIVLILVDDK
jgi:hypothetical protein